MKFKDNNVSKMKRLKILFVMRQAAADLNKAEKDLQKAANLRRNFIRQ